MNLFFAQATGCMASHIRIFIIMCILYYLSEKAPFNICCQRKCVATWIFVFAFSEIWGFFQSYLREQSLLTFSRIILPRSDWMTLRKCAEFNDAYKLLFSIKCFVVSSAIDSGKYSSNWYQGSYHLNYFKLCILVMHKIINSFAIWIG